MVLCPGMLSLRWHALVLSLLVILADRAQAARLVVTIDGLRSGTGDVYVALYSRPDQFPDGDYSDQHQKRPATLGPLTFVFDDLAPGTTRSAPVMMRMPMASSTRT